MSSVDSVILSMNDEVRKLETLLSIARDSELQREALDRVQILDANLEAQTARAVASGDESRANLMLGFRCVFGSLASELMMWLLLKSEEPEKAWDCLVDAQGSAVAATRAHPGFRHVEHHLQRLEAIEELVFPPQAFVSSGMIVSRQICKLCDADYEFCDHIAGMPYWGRFCTISGEEPRLDHVALVEHPADKRCRVVNVPTDSGYRNKMTWKLAPPGGEQMDAKILVASSDL